MTTSTRSVGNTASGLPSPHVEVEPGSLIGRYVVGEEIGRGSYSVVYEAQDRWLERRVALKTISRAATAGDAALHEARLLSSVRHPNVVGIYDFTRDRELDALVLELVDGSSVTSMVRRAPLDSQEVLDFAAQVVEGLAALHRAGIVHRDVKPANLRFSIDGAVKILDLGVSCAVEGAGRERSCASIAGAGTIPYMPPERLRGGGGDCRSDLWSVGAVMYELAVGRRLVDGLTSSGQSRFVRDGCFPPPAALVSALPSALRNIVARLLQPDPRHRYQTAEDLLDDLQSAVLGGDGFRDAVAACA